MSNINNGNRKEATTMNIKKGNNVDINLRNESEVFEPIIPIGPVEAAFYETDGTTVAIDFYSKDGKNITEIEYAKMMRENPEVINTYLRIKDDPRFDKRFKENEETIAEILGLHEEEAKETEIVQASCNICDVANGFNVDKMKAMPECEATPTTAGGWIHNKLTTNTVSKSMGWFGNLANPVNEKFPNDLHSSNIIERENKALTFGENYMANNEKKDALTIANEFMQMVSVRTVGDKYIYVYNNKFYESNTVWSLKRLINEKCKKEIKKYGNTHIVNEILNAVLYESKINIPALNIDERYVSFDNGILNLETRALGPHSRDKFIIYGVNGKYLGKGCYYSPVFEQFMQSITGGDENLKLRILQIIGFLLTVDTSAKAFFVFQGMPDSGKSILMDFIKLLISESVNMPFDIKEFGAKFSVSALFGKILSMAPDMPPIAIDSNAVGKIKQITGNDWISTDVKNEAMLKFKCKARIVMITNHAILLKQRDDAFINRAVVVPFRYTVPLENQNKNLLNELYEERDFIITNAINAYFEWRDNHSQFCGFYPLNDVVMHGGDECADVQTEIFRFVKFHFTQQPGSVVFIEDAYEKYVAEGGNCHINTFSHYFNDACQLLFEANKTRMRKNAAGNPQSAISGVAFI